MNGENGISFKELFSKDIDRNINGVIKANDEKNLDDEVNEYVLTEEICRNLAKFFDAYNDPMNHEQNGAWISGFFGSGKSHLLKMLSHILGDVPAELVDKGSEPSMNREQIVRAFVGKAEEQDDQMLAGQLEKALTIPATSILFNIDQKADKSNASDALMYAFVRVFDEVRGFYGKNPFVAKFERDLESNGYLDDFKQQFKQKADKSWSEGRDEAVLWDDEICKAYAAVTDKPVQDSIIQRYEDTYTMTVSDFADDVNTWLSQQEPNRRILFLVDEVGQFIGENRELMLSLQSIAEDLAVKTNGRAWVVVTSQEDMDTIVGDRTKQQSYDFSKIQGRFAIKLKLNSADVVEVIQKRLLNKKPEYEPAMNELWNEQSANLRTMFEFTRETSKFSNNKAYDKDDFIASYPFVNYEFGLFQNASREMSRYNMFSGRHASVGERSMLSAISSALRSCKDETVGELVPFDRLYDGIADAIQSTSNFRINQAERNLDPDVRELGVRLLKVLLLIKHVDGIPATPHNLRILLTDRFDTDIMALEQNIKHALEALEHDTYVQRVGDTYNYLTNEEQDIEQEIKGTDIDTAKESEELKRILLSDVLGKMIVTYGEQRASFHYGLRIDGVQQSTQQPIWLNVVTSVNAQDREDAIRMGMGMRDTITLLLDMSDKTLLDDLRMYIKTYTYLMRTDKNSQSEVRQQIISRKSVANGRLYTELRARVAKAAANGEFDYNGEEVEVKSTEAQAHVAEGLGTLIGRYYTNFSMLGGQRYEENDLARIIMNAAQRQSGTFEGLDVVKDKLDIPSDDVFATVSRGKNLGVVMTVKSVLDTYSASPYGWPYAATLACIGHLYGSDRITLTLDGKLVQRSEAARVLRETRKQDSIRVDLPRIFDMKKVSQLRDFAMEFFGLTAGDLPSIPTDLATSVAEKLKQESDNLKQLRARNANFDFIQQLDEPIEKITYASEKNVDWLLGDFILPETQNGSDKLLDLKEDVVDPIIAFINGSQSKILVEGLKWLRSNELNIDYASGDAADLYRSVEQLANDPNIFRKINKFKPAMAELCEKMDFIVQSEQKSALESVEQIHTRIIGSDEYRNATPSVQTEVESELNRIAERVRNTTFISTMRKTVNELKNAIHPQLINKLSAAVSEHQSALADDARIEVEESAGEDIPETRQAEPARVAVSFTTISRPRTKDALETTEDVDDFLDAYRRELIAAIRNGKKILL
ncbi:BREX system P-loop protein BrxC [Bifidobacterium dentium]|uniref:BREX system P-loop protein BrxC n=1 Tax=Bifidobacterium dentium TaxID=1689 RepID=UPI003D173611